MTDFDGHAWSMREPCAGCGATVGRITTRNGQDVVECAGCGRYGYCASTDETGRAARTLATRPTVKPSIRATIFERHGYVCVVCGRRPPAVTLEVAHLIPREVAARFGFLDWLIDADVNLAPMCPECNSGEAHIEWTWRRAALVYRALLSLTEGNRP